MRFFISGEIDWTVDKEFQRASLAVRNTLEEFLNQRDYGSELKELNIFPIIENAPREMIEQGWHKERKLFKRSSKSSDFRLKIDYHAFLNGSDSDRVNLIVKNILTAVEILGIRAKKDFDHERLKQDILNCFDKV
ncbi:Imm44 family immunity protein [Glaciecola sp. 1036]|uniref:Imm44 family immunity protein n=1 Tax=Alteromonadaceae TaxID=72275 RepID=UPI003CFDB05E